MKPGKQSTEFAAVVGFFAVAIVSGLDISDGVVNYAFNDNLLEYAQWIVVTYIGGRSAVKVMQAKNGMKETVKQAINEIYHEKEGQ